MSEMAETLALIKRAVKYALGTHPTIPHVWAEWSESFLEKEIPPSDEVLYLARRTEIKTEKYSMVQVTLAARSYCRVLENPINQELSLGLRVKQRLDNAENLLDAYEWASQALNEI